MILMKAGDIGAAGEQLRRACELDPDNVEYRNAYRAWRQAFSGSPGQDG